MKASELRLGNWVLYKDKNETPEFVNTKIGVSDFVIMYEKEKGEGWSEIDYAPIPLSPEILEMAGFSRLNNGWCIGEQKSYTDVIFSLFDDNMCQGELDLKLNGSDLPMPKVEHLHQLQNLYFSLTGQELTINL